MRIAFVSYDFGEYSMRHANALLEHGDVMLILPRQLSDPHMGLFDARVDFRPFLKPRLRDPLRQMWRMRWIVKQIREFEPEVIHFQAGHLWFNMALPRLKRFPLVVTVHDPRHHVGDLGSRNTPQWVMDFGYRRADRVIVHGLQLKEAVANGIGIARELIDVVPMIAVGERPEHVVANEEEGLVLFFGRIWGYKGIDYLIRAQPRISAAIPTAKIMIAGTGEDFGRYEALMEDPSRFIVHNRWISDDERALMFQRASVVVLPYVEATQTGVIPIAYTFSKPVVATSTGGLPDLVDHGKTGLLVPPRDEEALAQAVVQLLSDDQLRRRMGAGGRRKLDAECAPEFVAGKTAAVYRHAIAMRTATTHAPGSKPARAPSETD